jgi:hypothetical protein
MASQFLFQIVEAASVGDQQRQVVGGGQIGQFYAI